MLWTLILTTVLTGSYTESGPIAMTSVPGFASQQDCLQAIKLTEGEGISNIGRYNDYTFTSGRCVPMGVPAK